ncbi:MAG: hypothetical protein VX498_14860, partial [Myxococcota bacterium]|nr:hypothetical protein [Myxococcota bacterium]
LLLRLELLDGLLELLDGLLELLLLELLLLELLLLELDGLLEEEEGLRVVVPEERVDDELPRLELLRVELELDGLLDDAGVRVVVPEERLDDELLRVELLRVELLRVELDGLLEDAGLRVVVPEERVDDEPLRMARLDELVEPWLEELVPERPSLAPLRPVLPRGRTVLRPEFPDRPSGRLGRTVVLLALRCVWWRCRPE